MNNFSFNHNHEAESQQVPAIDEELPESQREELKDARNEYRGIYSDDYENVNLVFLN